MGMEREAEAGGRSLRTPADQEGGRRLSFREGGEHRWDQGQIFKCCCSASLQSLRSHFPGSLNTG